MKAAVLDRFGGPEELILRDIPVPSIGPSDVLIRVEYAGVGVWDIFEREGGYAEMLGMEPKFPYVLGSEGSGTISALGEKVMGFSIGDKVYAPGFLNPKGGFYAEYASVDSGCVSLIPGSMTTKEASVVSGAGITALRGLDLLKLENGRTVMIFGASGGVGHLAAQIAKNMGALVLAVASGEDGVAMVRRLGIDTAVDGRNDDVLHLARLFAPEGFDAALLTAGGDVAEKAIRHVRTGGRVAYPNGINPVPRSRPDLRPTGYNGDPDPEIIQRLSSCIEMCNLSVHVDRVFPMEDVREAHLALTSHYLGKLCLKVDHDYDF